MPKQGSCDGTGLALSAVDDVRMFRSGDCLPNRRSAGEDAPTTSNVMGGARARERAVLTLNYVRAVWDLKSAARFAAALSLAVVTLVVIGTVAYAEGAAVGGCIGSEETLNCATRWGEAGDPYVRIVPPPGSEEERGHAAEREHRWEQRCKPLVAQDRYGVARYRYSAPGCEFGILD